MSGKLGLGKVNREVFNRSVLPFIPVEKALELDGATTTLSGHTVIAHSPSIGVPIEALGFFAFHYSASNVASKFGKPSHLISGIYLPLKTTEEELRIITKGLGNEAKKYGVTVTAGQTATYYGLDIPLLTTTCIGESIRTPDDVDDGDLILLVGEVGGEAVWLERLSKENHVEEMWRGFTPLPIILSLQTVSGVKLMHDVSEGGVKGSLFEVANSINYGIKASSDGVALYQGAENLSGDIFKAPSYSTLIVIIELNAVEHVQSICEEQGVPCKVIGEIISDQGLIFDGESIDKQERINLDEIYGSFTQTDSLIVELKDAIEHVIGISNLVELVPEVGMNMLFARQDSKSSEDIAGLSGRIIKAMGKVKACGEVVYGASRYLSSVVLEANRLDGSIRAAVNLRGGDDIKTILEKLGLRVKCLPSVIEGDGCPVAIHLKTADTLFDAYIHPGSFGIEPTTTILGKTPRELVEILQKMVRLAR